MSRRTLAAVFAHPDDETFTIGGTVARLAAEGVGCHLLCVTAGDAGRATGLGETPGATLGALRRDELREAAAVLGFGEARVGGYPDGALAAADQDALVGDVVRFLRETRAEVLVTWGPEGGPNAHPDHRAVSRAATAAYFLAGLPTAYREQLDAGLAAHAARRLYYFTWTAAMPAGMPGVGGLPPSVAVPIAAWHDVKRRAFVAHRTQQHLRDRFVGASLVDVEEFALASGVPLPPGPQADLFAGM